MDQTLVLNVAQKTGREGARRNARNLAIVLVASILLLVGCTGGASLEGTQWVLVTLEGEPPALRLQTRRLRIRVLPRVLHSEEAVDEAVRTPSVSKERRASDFVAVTVRLVFGYRGSSS
jgi:hypothetical protein